MNYINIELEQGTSYLLQMVYEDEVTGIPKDLTDYTAILSVTPFAGLPPTITLTSESTSIVLGGVTGSIKAYFSPAVTSITDWDQAPYDLFLTDPLGVKVKVIKGLVTVNPSESV